MYISKFLCPWLHNDRFSRRKTKTKNIQYSCTILNLDGTIAHVSDIKVFSTYHYHVQAGPSVN